MAVEEPATADDLAKFFLENWANKLNITMSEASGLTGTFIPGFALKSNRFEVCKAFSELVISEEDTYGHLPEYWELRSMLDRKTGNDLFADPENAKLDWLFAAELLEPRINPDVLQKALDIDPDRGSLHYFIGRLELNEKYDEPYGPRKDESGDYEEFCNELAGVYSKASKAEPGNAFYPTYEAVYLFHGGDSAGALYALERAALCEYWSHPRIFPSTFVIDHVMDYEKRSGLFSDISPGARFNLYIDFYTGMDELPNYIQLRDMYKGLTAECGSEDNWRETFTILHRVACIMATGEGNETIHCIFGGTHARIVAKEALNLASEEGDAGLGMALHAAIGLMDQPKWLHKAGMVCDGSSELTYTLLFTFLLEYFQEELEDVTEPSLDIAISDFIPPVMHYRISWQIHDELIKPIFEDLLKFDYENPGEWYGTWYENLCICSIMHWAIRQKGSFMTLVKDIQEGKDRPEIKEIVEREGCCEKCLVQGIRDGRVVIPKNAKRSFPACGIGWKLHTKVNSNIGTSPDWSNIDVEIEKLNVTLDAKADTVMDLSTGGDLKAIRQELLDRSPIPFGTVPIYEMAKRALDAGREFNDLDTDTLFEVIESISSRCIRALRWKASRSSDATRACLASYRVGEVSSRRG